MFYDICSLVSMNDESAFQFYIVFCFKVIFFFVAHSLRHKSTGKCVHLYGASPREGVECCLWQGCDEERTKVNFMKQGQAWIADSSVDKFSKLI